MNESDEKNLLETAKRLRHDREHALDELTIARLRAARLNAVAKKRGSRRSWRLAGALAATGFALAVAGIVWLQTPSQLTPPPTAESAALTDIDMLSSTDGPDFYGNLEFYRWLATQSNAS